MKDHIWKRVLEVSRYISRTKATVRETAKVFDVSKSTVHKDVTERLPKLNPELAARVKKVLDYNKAERHLRGGEATRRKYLHDERADEARPEVAGKDPERADKAHEEASTVKLK